MIDRRFAAMGTQCHVVVDAPEPIASTLLDLARTRVELLEQCWSRFRPDSELSALNASAGQGPFAASGDLLLLVRHMQQAWADTDGLFDPTVLTAMRQWGYDADFATVVARQSVAAVAVTTAAPGMAAVLVDDAGVTLPVGVGLDPGAIGKGLAADLIAADLREAGAAGVLVNLGGDIAVAGTPADGGPWRITVDDERDAGRPLDTLTIDTGGTQGVTHAGIATSTTLTRRWAQGRRHHVIDPRTGGLGAHDLVQVTVVAPQAWQAEVAATAALLRPADAAASWLTDRQLSGILLTDDARVDVGMGGAA